ncbi:MAG: hypothetical protein HY727_15235 [Candidatus Rokubacteria bacterium]|nr:hypothetical protein [Candidatus Rokubacteria bacterium]
MSTGKPLGNLIDIIPAILPLDLQTARDGDYISLKHAQGVAVVVFKGAGTAGDDPLISFQQAQDVAGTGVKDLATIATIFKKQGTLTAVGTWSKVTQAAGASFQADATSAEEEAVYVFEIEADELDVDNGFDCLRVRVADTGTNAQLGCALYLLYGQRYAATPANLPSSIVD